MRVTPDQQGIFKGILKCYIQHPILSFAFTYMVAAISVNIYKRPDLSLPGPLKSTPHESVILT